MKNYVEERIGRLEEDLKRAKETKVKKEFGESTCNHTDYFTEDSFIKSYEPTEKYIGNVGIGDKGKTHLETLKEVKERGAKGRLNSVIEEFKERSVRFKGGFGDEYDLERIKEIEEKKVSETPNQKSEDNLILDPSSSYIKTGDTKLKIDFDVTSADIKLGVSSDAQPPFKLNFLGSAQPFGLLDFGPKKCTVNDKWAYFIHENKTIATNRDNCFWDDKYIVVPDIEYDWVETEESRGLRYDIAQVDNKYLKDIINEYSSCNALKKQITIFKGLSSYLLDFCEFYLGVSCGVGTESPKSKLEIIGREDGNI